jgi:predicted negative regulator of RcsB-dependent stress response
MIIDYYTDGTREDKLAFELFFKAEKLINEFDVKGAVKVLQTIEMDYNDSLVSPLASLRLAFIFIDLKQYDKSLEYALAVSATSLKDKGLALAAEIEEHFLKSKDNALQYYYRLLSESPNSILSEPVRLHIRKISQPNES